MTNITVLNQIVNESEVEVGIGIIALTPYHRVITWGEYAEQGEPDGEIRVMGAIDDEGNDLTDKVAQTVTNAIRDALLGEGFGETEVFASTPRDEELPEGWARCSVSQYNSKSSAYTDGFLKGWNARKSMGGSDV